MHERGNEKRKIGLNYGPNFPYLGVVFFCYRGSLFVIRFEILLLHEQLYIRGKRVFFDTMVFVVGLVGLFTHIPFILATAGPGGSNGYIDPRFKRVLWYLIGSTKGGVNRAKIIDFINSHPANANQIASELNLDYKTVVHHLRVLGDNGLVITEKEDSYGATYFLTPLMEKNYLSFMEILARIEKK